MAATSDNPPTSAHTNGTTTHSAPPEITIIGAGLGGLTLAIACRRHNLPVLVLEKAAQISELGAGIQLPPNAVRVMRSIGVFDKLLARGCAMKEQNAILRWDGSAELGARPGKEWAKEKFGEGWCVMHRAEYAAVLAEEAEALGAEMRLGVDVVGVEDGGVVRLADGQTLEGADVVVGADGLRSIARGTAGNVTETGDLAYRVTIPTSILEDETDPFIRGVVDKGLNAIWWGANMHVVLYTVSQASRPLLNLVLLCPDDLPADISKLPGSREEMHALFASWDPRLRLLLNKVPGPPLKWRIFSMPALETWSHDNLTLLGDACHPSLPYAASGAAMAVEDAAVLGHLLGEFTKHNLPPKEVPSLLKLYEGLRKQRTTTVVKAAESNRELFHMPDGEAQRRRDGMLQRHDWWDGKAEFPWVFADGGFLSELYGFDAVGSAEKGFRRWMEDRVE